MHALFRSFFHYTTKTAEIQRHFCNFLQEVLANRSKNFFFFRTILIIIEQICYTVLLFSAIINYRISRFPKCRNLHFVILI